MKKKKSGLSRLLGIVIKVLLGILALLVVLMVIGMTHPAPEPEPTPAPTAEPEPTDFAEWIAWKVSPYPDTTVDHITVNDDLGTADPNDKIGLVYLNWTTPNTYDTAKSVLEVYSNEIFAPAKEKFASFSEIVLFWQSSHLNQTIKFSFER